MKGLGTTGKVFSRFYHADATPLDVELDRILIVQGDRRLPTTTDLDLIDALNLAGFLADCMPGLAYHVGAIRRPKDVTEISTAIPFRTIATFFHFSNGDPVRPPRAIFAETTDVQPETTDVQPGGEET